MAATYWQKLKDPRWQKRRLDVLNKAEFACEVCYDKDSTLHVHHLKYDKGKDPWEYDDRWLACVCESCHEELHAAKELLMQSVSALSAQDTLKVAGYAFALSGMALEMGLKGNESMPVEVCGGEAIGIYDAIRFLLPQPIHPNQDLAECQIERLIDSRGNVSRGAIWGLMTEWLERRRAERNAAHQNN